MLLRDVCGQSDLLSAGKGPFSSDVCHQRRKASFAACVRGCDIKWGKAEGAVLALDVSGDDIGGENRITERLQRTIFK